MSGAMPISPSYIPSWYGRRQLYLSDDDDDDNDNNKCTVTRHFYVSVVKCCCVSEFYIE